jgi:hypothetical protein
VRDLWSILSIDLEMDISIVLGGDIDGHALLTTLGVGDGNTK